MTFLSKGSVRKLSCTESGWNDCFLRHASDDILLMALQTVKKDMHTLSDAKLNPVILAERTYREEPK